MKKIAVLCLAMVLVLSLCVPAVARYDQCKKCESGLLRTETTTSLSQDTVQCTKDTSKQDMIYIYKTYAVCDNCGYSYLAHTESKVICGH